MGHRIILLVIFFFPNRIEYKSYCTVLYSTAVRWPGARKKERGGRKRKRAPPKWSKPPQTRNSGVARAERAAPATISDWNRNWNRIESLVKRHDSFDSSAPTTETDW